MTFSISPCERYYFPFKMVLEEWAVSQATPIVMSRGAL